MSYLTVQWPWMLLLLLGLFPLSRVLRHARLQRARVYRALGRQTPGTGFIRDRLRITGMALLILALSRPGFDPERRSIAQEGRDIVFAIDVSRSMLARDAKPSRLEVAKQGVRDALARFQGERVGLLIYAGSASILCPLTRDYGFIRYMLDQATPRTVDFGGTALLSAVEKSVDNLFIEGRDGMQDLVVLTDGEDHAFDMERIAKTLGEANVDLLVIGLGDSVNGARIPVENEDGNLTYLKYKDREVYSTLQDDTLKELVAGMPGSRYMGCGTAAFDLGGIYEDFATDKPVEESASAEAYVVYKEAGLLLAAIGLLLFLVTDGFSKRLFTLLVAALATGAVSAGGSGILRESFDAAIELQLKGSQEEALEAYGDLLLRMDGVDVAPEELAVIRFNQGLCHETMAAVHGNESPESALAAARMAKICYLDAKRMDPSVSRAGMRLDPIAVMISEYEILVQAMEEQEQAMQEQLNKLIERLEALYEAQMSLRETLSMRDPASPQNRPNRRDAANQAPPEPVPPPSSQEVAGFASLQTAHRDEGTSIGDELEMLNNILTPPPIPGEPPVKGLLQEPVDLMNKAVDYQQTALQGIPDLSRWELVRASQNLAGEKIQEILELLSNDSSQSDEGDWEDYEEDWDMEDYEEGEEGMPSSRMMQGDLAAGVEMQPLPVPNYSAEELLLEEMGNLQFRQEQRAKAQAGKVEKDW